MSTVLYRRPPRRPPPQMPKGEVIFESPPEMPEEETAGGGMQKWLSVLPMAGGAVSMVFMATMFTSGTGGTGSQTMRMIAMALMGVSTMGMGLSQLGNRGADRRRKVDGSRRDYLRYLAQLRRRIRAAADKQREALEFRYPDPGQLWAVPLSRRLWERRPNDKDFGHVRLARGSQGFLLKLVAPETKPVEDLDPVSSGALRRFIQTYRRVNDLPVALSLRAFAHVRMDGDVDAIRDLTRAMLAHVATFHAPHEMILAFCVGPDRRAEWDWVKWLPHTLHPAATDGAGHLRFVAGSMSELERMLADQLTNRPYFAPDGAPLTDAPHVIVVVDGGHAGPDSLFVSQPWQGTTLIDVTGQAARQGGSGVLRLAVEKNEVGHVTRDRDEKWRTTPLGKPDAISVTEIEALARTLAPLRATTATGKAAESAEAEVEEEKPQFENDLMQLLNIQDAYNLNLEELWKPRPRESRLRIPFGLDDKGMPIELDIKEAAQGGMGPHGLVIGATGSGKSEVLRTIVLGLVATHSPDYLNLVLVDFKGGATFLELDKLPHTSAVITNLEGELTLVDRMQDAIAGEMARRQELLASAGNYGSLRDYEEDRAKGKPLDPLPTLWIVADEFSELLTAKPEFIDVFLQIGRIGRSIGVHLLLASQRLEEGKLKGLDTFLSYRFGLRTFSAAESRTVIGVPDAFELPREPGGGYLKVGTDYMQRFRAAYVGAPYVRPTAGTVGGKRKAPPKPGEKRFVPQITAYTTDYVEPNIVEIPAEPEPEQEVQQAAQGPAPGEPKVLLDLIVEQLIGKGRPAHQVWLPPLNEPPTMDGLLPPLKTSEEFGLNADWEGRGTLQVPVALVDRPYHQRRDPMWLDLSGAGGHVGICGGPQSGKSTAVRALIAALAMTHTPEEVGIYCLDFGGGTLPAMAGLPHVGGVATRLDADGIRRTIGEMTTLLEQRELRFTENGIDSIATYRRMRRQNRIEPDRFPSDVFLVIDGWGTVRADHEQIEQQVTTLANRGLGFGIHVVATAVKWNEFRAQIKPLLQTKLELRQGDPYDSEIDRRAAANVPNNRPGRGLTPEKLHFLGALPRIDGVEDDDDLADGVKAMCEASAAAWKRQPAAPVRLLPERLDIKTLPQPGDQPKHLVPIGIDEDNLQPVSLDFLEEPHLFLTGQIECGKSNLLDVILKSIVARYTPKEAKVVIIDYRRAQLESITGNDHLIGYAASSGAATDMLKDIAAVVRKRLPGPDVTPEQLKNRSWWTGSDLFVVVDDYDLVATSSGNPLSPFVDMVSQARDIGLHVIISRGFGGVGRAMHDPIVQRMRDMGNPAIIMSGTKEEGKLYGYTATPLVPGRGMLVSRRLGNKLIQTAYLPRPGEES